MAISTKSRSRKTALDGAIACGQKFSQWVYQWLVPAAESSEYRTWRQQFMRDRVRLAWWIAALCFLTIVAVNFYVLFFHASQYDADMAKIYGSKTLGGLTRQVTLVSSIVLGCCLFISWLMQRIRWFQHRPMLLFLSLSCSLTLSEQVVGTFFRLPIPPEWTLEFLGQALLIPVCWRLHLLLQLMPTLYYAIVNPLFGITSIGERSIYDAYNVGMIVRLSWVCLICNLAVYLYEQLKRSEFEAQRQLKVFLHSVSHDLRNPVMGTSIVLANLLRKSEQQVTLDRSLLERLQQGNDRQLTLINSLLEAHNTEIQGVQLICEPFSLQDVIDSVLSDLLPILEQHQINLRDRVPANLPLVNGDAHQLWRVYCNLITNAIKHNPNGITVTLTADVIKPEARGKNLFCSDVHDCKQRWLRCSVQDTGVGIEPQHRQNLFNLYTRGSRARYMPGLGLGLYLCKQIITAHGGTMEVSSDRGKGTTFWFTLPLA
jgi:signal transduction histidine kinase